MIWTSKHTLTHRLEHLFEGAAVHLIAGRVGARRLRWLAVQRVRALAPHPLLLLQGHLQRNGVTVSLSLICEPTAGATRSDIEVLFISLWKIPNHFLPFLAGQQL